MSETLGVILWGLASLGPMQSAPASAPTAEITAEAPHEPVEFGRPFPLTVRRSWAKGTEPQAWNDAALAPLVVRLRGATRRDEGNRIVETRTFDASAFALGAVDVPAVHLHLEVASALPEPAGEVEPPPGPFDAPFDVRRAAWVSLAVVAAAAIAYALFRWWRRPPAAENVVLAPPPPPDERALARIAALRRTSLATPEEVQLYYVEASSIVREYLEERFRVRAPEMTTEEFLASEAASRALEVAHRSLLAEFLGHCDLVKFGRGASTSADRERLLQSAERLVLETRAGAAVVAGASR